MFKITNSIVTLPPAKSPPNLLGFADVVIESAVMIHDMRILNRNGNLMLAMPNRRQHKFCPGCGEKIPHHAKFCSQCGIPQGEDTTKKESRFFDIVHAITPEARGYLEREVFGSYARTKFKAEENRKGK